VVLVLTPGQASDARTAPRLLAAARRGGTRAVVAARGYDADALVAWVRRGRARCVIPPMRHRRHRRRYPRRLYRLRNVVARLWRRVNQCRRAATRYDKLDANYLGFVQIAALLAILRGV
jgi:putative transposase